MAWWRASAPAGNCGPTVLYGKMVICSWHVYSRLARLLIQLDPLALLLMPESGAEKRRVAQSSG